MRTVEHPVRASSGGRVYENSKSIRGYMRTVRASGGI